MSDIGKLSKRQGEAYSYMLDFVQLNGRMPTQREVMHKFSMNAPASGYQLFQSFVRKGLIERTGHGSYVLTGRCPCCGRG